VARLSFTADFLPIPYFLLKSSDVGPQVHAIGNQLGQSKKRGAQALIAKELTLSKYGQIHLRR
jgi:hypothetical protein